jgi:type VI secretion system ImpM family protein
MGLFGGKRGKEAQAAPRGRQPAVVGLFGKHPSSREFYRTNTSDVVRDFDDWLGPALATCERSLPDWPACFDKGSTVSFVHHHPGLNRSLIGVLAPSRDQQRRRYPLVVFGELDSSWLCDRFPALPFLDFVLDVQAGLERRAELTGQMLEYIPERLAAPHPHDLEQAWHETQRQLGQISWGQALAPLFDRAPGRQLLAAVDATRAFGQALGAGNAPRYLLRCPLSLALPQVTAAFWLELVRRAAGPAALPTVLWRERGMVLCGGPLSHKALAALLRLVWTDEAILDLDLLSGGKGQPPDPELSLEALLD